jgi:hypothetical protein
VAAGDAEFEALRDTLRAFDEMGSGHWRAESGGRGFEQGEPAVEVAGVHRQGQVPAHRVAVIVARHQRHRRPEGAHSGQVRVPVADMHVEYRPKQGVGAHLGVEAVHQASDHRRVDAGPAGDVDGQRAALFDHGYLQGVFIIPI